MYVTINNIVGGKRINLAYPIRGKEVAVVSIFSDNAQCRAKKPCKVLMSNEERILLEGTFMANELSPFVGRNLTIAHWMAAITSLIRTSFVGVMGMVISLDELDNTDNLEYGRLSNVLQSMHNG